MSDKEKNNRHKRSTLKRDTPTPAPRTLNVSPSDAPKTSHQKKNAEKEVQLLLTALECSLVSPSRKPEFQKMKYSCKRSFKIYPKISFRC